MGLVTSRPPRTLWAGFCAVAITLRVLGPGRTLVAGLAGSVSYALQPGRRRRAIAHHLRLDPGISAGEARRRARASFREFVRVALDFFWASGMGPEEALVHGSVVTGLNLCREAQAAGRGGVLALTHFGNWDMAAIVAHAVGLQLSTVMAVTGPPAVSEVVAWARRRNQLEVFVPNGALDGLRDALRRNRFVAILCDITARGSTVDVDYCGGRVAFSRTPARLAMETGAPILPAACWREGGHYCGAVLGSITAQPGDDEEALMQRVASAIDPVVRRHPDQWYPFRTVYAGE
jgi:phosphatidylinositol dimannoside acyltransferase